MLNGAALNKQLQKGQGTWGHAKKDHMTDIRKVLNGCGKQSEKGPDTLREDEKTG